MMARRTGPPTTFDMITKGCHAAAACALVLVLFAAAALGSSGVNDLLTPAERLWLTENRSRIVLAVETGYPPFVFLDPKGRPRGLAHDYLLLLESKLGVHFTQKQFSTLDTILESVRGGEVQIVNAVTKTPGRSGYLSFTDPFISVPNVILVRKEHPGGMLEKDLTGLKVSLVQSYAITEHLANKRPALDIDLVPDDLTAILNVSFGRSDAAVIDLATASYLISLKGITNIRVAGEASYAIDLSMGVPRSEPMLHSILQKGLHAISEAERLDIHERWIRASSQSTLTDRRLWIAVAGISAALLGTIAGILVWNRTLRRLVELRTEALASEKAFLRSLIDSADDLIYFKDTKGIYLGCNKASEKFMGRSEREQIGTSDFDLMDRRTAEQAEKQDRLVLGGGGILRSEDWVTCADGSRVLLDSVKAPIWGPDGQPIGLVGISRDITERKKIEDELRQTRAILQAAMGCSSAGIIIADAPDGRLRYVNDAGLLILGGNRQDVVTGVAIDQHVASWQLLGLDGTPLRTDEVPLARTILYGETCSRELIIRRAADDDRTVLANAAPIKDESGTVLAGIVVFADITERKQQEEAIRKSEYEFRMLAEAMPQIVWTCSAEGLCTYSNQQWVEYTGLSLEESYGEGWTKPLHPDDRQRAWDAWQNATINGMAYAPECRLRRADGVYKWWLIRGVPVLDAQGAILKWFGTCTDIDELKQFEQELKDKNSELERFTYTVSHDLKSPLITINTFAGLIRQELAAGKHAHVSEDLGRISDAATKMGMLLDDLLQLSRIGRMINEPTRIDMNALVKETLALLEGPVSQSRIEFVVQADLPEISGDRQRIGMVLQNLLENAVKYMGDQPAPCIGIGACRAGHETVFFVNDNGIGIDPRQHESIFGLFKKLDPKSPGTGIGLALVKRIIEIHGGRVWAESEGPGSGSRFLFTVPELRTCEEPPQPVVSPTGDIDG